MYGHNATDEQQVSRNHKAAVEVAIVWYNGHAVPGYIRRGSSCAEARRRLNGKMSVRWYASSPATSKQQASAGVIIFAGTLLFLSLQRTSQALTCTNHFQRS